MGVRLAVASLPALYGDRDALATAMAERAQGADILLLPEAFLPGYRHQSDHQKNTALALAKHLAKRHHLHLALGFLEGNGCYLGMASPTGQWWDYQKQFPSPAEARFWKGGRQPGIASTVVGRVGLLICADVLQLSAWQALQGRVDVVLVAAAWPDYQGRPPPGLGWLYAQSNPYRDELLASAAQVLGVPVAFANASGPGFSGGSRIWNAAGECVGKGDFVCAEVVGGQPQGTLRHRGRWRLFTPIYRRVSQLVQRL